VAGTNSAQWSFRHKNVDEQYYSASLGNEQGCIQGVSLAVITDPFVPQIGYSVLKPMTIFQTRSLQVSNAGGLEQATAYISLSTLHSTIGGGYEGVIATYIASPLQV